MVNGVVRDEADELVTPGTWNADAPADDESRLAGAPAPASGREPAIPAAGEETPLGAAVLGELEEAVMIVDTDGRLAYANEAARRLADIAPAERVRAERPHFATIWNEDPSVLGALMERLAVARSWQRFTLTSAEGAQAGRRAQLRGKVIFVRRGGRATPYLLVMADTSGARTAADQQQRLGALHEDVAESKAAQAALRRKLAREQERHRELVHRVKNNLTLLVSLARASRRKLAEPEFERELESLERRLMSLATMHEILDATHQTDVVRADQMVARICEAMSDAVAPQGVTIRCDLAPTELSVKDATPLALVVNELATNALKHAFPGARAGTIDIALARGVDEVSVTVADDGVGICPQGADGKPSSGSRIVKALLTQLGAKARCEPGASGQGTVWRLSFRPVQQA